MKREKLYWWASSYSGIEKIRYLRDRVMLPSKRHKNDFSEIVTHSTVLQNLSDEVIKIGFTGDLMPVGDSKIKISPEFSAYLNSVDILVINLEGIITKKRRYLALSHDKSILEFIGSLAERKKILINVANNHAGDFGSGEFYKSIKWIESFGFETFGYKEKPFIDVDKFRFYSATNWSNQQFYEINRFDIHELSDINWFYNNMKINIFLPHWGYEMQLYPTKKQVEFTRKIFGTWDLVVGSHTHCPQPCVLNTVNGNDKLIAYSLGNFAYSHYNPNHYFGAFLFLKFNKNIEKPVLAEYEFKLTQMKSENGEITIDFKPVLQYKSLRSEKLRRMFRFKLHRKLNISG